MAFLGELKRRNVVRVGAAYAALSWLIVQLVETLFPLFGISDAAARMVVVVLAVGFLPTVVFAWVFELTPEGLRRETGIDHDSAASRRMTRWMDRVILVLLVLAVSYFALDKFLLAPHRQSVAVQSATDAARREGRAEATVEAYGDKSIAVLPFVNLSPDPEQEYLGDGLAEELLNLLAHVPELRVISRSSAFSFKGKDTDLRTIARELNVAHVLEGAVRKSGDRIRITAQLVEARSDTNLWAATFEREIDDIFAIQDEVAAEVIRQLRVTLLGEPPTTSPVDPAAYTLYLQARHLTYVQPDDWLSAAGELLGEALEIEADYVDALVLLALVLSEQERMSSDSLASEQRRTLRERYEQIRDQVLRVDPDNPQMKAHIAYSLGIDRREEAARLLEEAARADPFDTFVIFVSANRAMDLGRIDLGVRLYEHLAERDPLFLWAHLNLAGAYLAAGRPEAALERYAIAKTINPSGGAVNWKMGIARLVTGDAEGARLAFEAEPGEAYRYHGLAMAYHDLALGDESAEALRIVVEREKDIWPFGLARAFAWIGNADEAFRYLQQTADSQPAYLGGVATEPLLRKLHDDPRWMPFLRSVGQAPEQLAGIRFDISPPE
jgi:adenylate cyclase